MAGCLSTLRRSAERHLLRALLHSTPQPHTAAAAEATAAAAAHVPRGFASSSAQHEDVPAEDAAARPFDAAEYGGPLRVHQLIGDPRTGVADDTTTAPFGEDIAVENIYSCPSSGAEWYRYSLAGDARPFMHMDARLSDHSRNLMYLLRRKDPERWTIEALADKFRVRRQRVMAILALKEQQAHRLDAGSDMTGPLAPYVLRVPMADFHLQPDGEPLDLAQLVAQQDALQQQQQQQQQGGGAAAAAAGAGPGGVQPAAAAAADGLGSLEDFLAPEEAGSSGTADSSSSSSSTLGSLGAAAASSNQAADLAVCMPQVALTAQQLHLQLLHLLERHHYSVEELQRQLMQQVDAAQAYYNAHVAGTPLEQLLLQQQAGNAPAAAAAAAGADADGEAAAEAADGGSEQAAAEAAAPSRPAWLDFDRQRQEIRQLLAVLEPLLQTAGDAQARQAGQLMVRLTHAMEQPQEGADQQLPALVAAADPPTLARAFNQLPLARRQQLLEAAPEARIALNVQGTDLRAAVQDDSSSSSSGWGEAGAGDAAAAAAAAGAGAAAGMFSAPRSWPGEVPGLVDVWGYEEISRPQLEALQQQLPRMQAVLDQLQDGREAGAAADADDIAALQRAVQLYCGLVHEYDRVINQQAAAAAAGDSRSTAASTSSLDTPPPPPLLPPSQQRRLIRILRELDMHAVDKLLLWESYFQAVAEHQQQQRGARGARGARGQRALNLHKNKVVAALARLDAQAAEAGQPGPYDGYPDLPADTPRSLRVDKDMSAAHLEAVIVGRQFHRGSGDRHYTRLMTYPSFEGASLEEFDAAAEGEISMLTRLATEREDNMMWKEFRQQLLRNMGLLGPDLHGHVGLVKPPRPEAGWSWVVHPMAGSARALTRQQLQQQAEAQWLAEDGSAGDAHVAVDVAAQPPPADPARGAAPAGPYVSQPDGRFRGLNEGEALLVGDTLPKPRRRWYASMKR